MWKRNWSKQPSWDLQHVNCKSRQADDTLRPFEANQPSQTSQNSLQEFLSHRHRQQTKKVANSFRSFTELSARTSRRLWVRGRMCRIFVGYTRRWLKNEGKDFWVFYLWYFVISLLHVVACGGIYFRTLSSMNSNSQCVRPAWSLATGRKLLRPSNALHRNGEVGWLWWFILEGFHQICPSRICSC